MLKGLGGLGDMAKMMSAAKNMQSKMGELQESLAKAEVTGTSGGGLVSVTANAKGEVRSVSLDPSILKAEEREVVEDLVLAAIKDAQAKAASKSNDEMTALTESLGLPAGFKLPF